MRCAIPSAATEKMGEITDLPVYLVRKTKELL